MTLYETAYTFAINWFDRHAPKAITASGESTYNRVWGLAYTATLEHCGCAEEEIAGDPEGPDGDIQQAVWDALEARPDGMEAVAEFEAEHERRRENHN